jgi:hypothetical protein
MRLVFSGLAVAGSNVSLDHPGWLRETCGRVRRAFRFDNTVCTAICEANHVTFEPTVETGTPADATTMSSLIDWFDSASLPASFRATVPFRHDTRVQRVRNPDLWDALLPPIFRQRRRAQDVESLYRRFCINHGSIIATTAGLTLLPPTPESVAGLPDDAFIKLGMRDKRRPLRAAAEACLNRASEWDELPPGKLFAGLQTRTPRRALDRRRGSSRPHQRLQLLHPPGRRGLPTVERIPRPAISRPVRTRLRPGVGDSPLRTPLNTDRTHPGRTPSTAHR